MTNRNAYLRSTVPTKDLMAGWTYYVVLDEVNVRICVDEEDDTQPKRFLSVAAAQEWARKRTVLFTVLEMNMREANRIQQHITIRLH